MTPDLIRALAISGSILIAVVILIIIISVVAVRRGENQMAQGPNNTQHGHSRRH